MELKFLKVFLTTGLAILALSEAQPTVTLSHGGKLQGRSETFNDVPVDLFLGVRYAKPPLGDLRFKKPEVFPGWEGTVDATKVAKICPQLALYNNTPEYVGEEDCLFMDITVPNGVKAGANKAVMVWIHGGGFMSGTGLCYIGGSLAVTGDVIVVSINYRLGILGLLTSLEKGSPTNFALWDQRAALVWVKENIAQFGGDPDLVTIFGESAGAASVSFQLLGQHNDGLFKRGITQSGSAYMMFNKSLREKSEVVAAIQKHTNCAEHIEVFDCLRHLPAEDVIKIQVPTYFSPVADNDFFAEEIGETQSYSPAHRFDLMAGMNGQEGGLFYEFEMRMIAAQQNKSSDEGVDMELANYYLEYKCRTQITPLSPKLCADFVIKTYKLDEEKIDDKERAIRLTKFLGESVFDMDTVNQLEQHSSSDKSTYGYFFTEHYKSAVKNPLWNMQEWMKTSADHGDELPFMFGAADIAKEVAKGGIWKEMLSTEKLVEGFLSLVEDHPLSLKMVKMWTNFAKTGNPNEPMALDSSIPVWPEFTPESNVFLELNSKQIRVIQTPNKDRLDNLREKLYETRKLQVAADIAVAAADEPTSDGATHDEL